MWIDHNRFADVRTRDETQPAWFGHRFQVHDGHLDITNESDYVTVSWNQFVSHDKTMLIGNSDEARPRIASKLRVTLHHNLFDDVGQRMPRVRYRAACTCTTISTALSGDTNYHSSWGVGVESQHLRGEQLLRASSAMFGPMEVIDGKKGTALTAIGNCWTEKAALRAHRFHRGVELASSIRT